MRASHAGLEQALAKQAGATNGIAALSVSTNKAFAQWRELEAQFRELEAAFLHLDEPQDVSGKVLEDMSSLVVRVVAVKTKCEDCSKAFTTAAELEQAAHRKFFTDCNDTIATLVGAGFHYLSVTVAAAERTLARLEEQERRVQPVRGASFM